MNFKHLVAFCIVSFSSGYLISRYMSTHDLQAIFCKEMIFVHLLAWMIILAFSGKLIFSFFIGNLRIQEFDTFQDELVHFAIQNLLFILNVLHPSTIADAVFWVVWFSVTGFIKAFCVLGRERSGYLMNSLSTQRTVHLKLISLLFLVILANLCWCYCGYLFFGDAGWAALLLLLFEIWIIFIDSAQTTTKYGLYLINLFTDKSSGYAEEKIMYYAMFAADTVRLLSALGHYIHIWFINGFTFSIIDCVLFILLRKTLKDLGDKIAKFSNYRRITQVINDSYPDATAEELKDNEICSVCHEDMQTAKKLPCGHLFHISCINRCMQYSNKCPLCQRSLLPTSQTAAGSENNASTSTSSNATATATSSPETESVNNNRTQQSIDSTTTSTLNPHAPPLQRYLQSQQQQQSNASAPETRTTPTTATAVTPTSDNNQTFSLFGDAAEIWSNLLPRVSVEVMRHQTPPLTPTEPVNNTFAASPPPAAGARTASPYSVQATPSLAVQVQQIREMFPFLPVQRIEQELIRCRGSTELAVNNLLDA